MPTLAKHNVGIAIGLTLLASTGSAQPLSLNQVLSAVDRSYPQIRAGIAEVHAKQAKIMSAEGAFDPTVNSYGRDTPRGGWVNGFVNNEIDFPTKFYGTEFFAGYLWGQGDFREYEKYYKTNSHGQWMTGVRLPILQNHATDVPRTQLANSKLRQDAQVQQLRETHNQVRQAASMAYWRWVMAGKAVLLYQHLVDLATARQSALDAQYQQGHASRIALVDNERTIMQRRADYQDAQANLATAQYNLSLYYRDALGHPKMVPTNQLPTTLPPLYTIKTNALMQTWHLLDSAVTQPVLAELTRKIDIQKNTLALTRNQRLPELNMQFYAEKDNGSGDPRLNITSYFAGFNFNLPLYRREARGNNQAAADQLNALEYRRQLTGEKLVIDLKQTLVRLKFLEQQLQTRSHEVDYAQQVAAAERTSYEKGYSNLFLVNRREQDTAQAQLTLYGTRLQYFSELVQLQRLCNFNHRCESLFLTTNAT